MYRKHVALYLSAQHSPICAILFHFIRRCGNIHVAHIVMNTLSFVTYSVSYRFQEKRIYAQKEAQRFTILA